MCITCVPFQIRENTELTKICDELLSKYGDKLWGISNGQKCFSLSLHSLSLSLLFTVASSLHSPPIFPSIKRALSCACSIPSNVYFCTKPPTAIISKMCKYVPPLSHFPSFLYHNSVGRATDALAEDVRISSQTELYKNICLPTRAFLTYYSEG